MSHRNGKRFQYVWWGWGAVLERILEKTSNVGLYGPYPNKPGDPQVHGAVYKWMLVLGPLEIRRWGYVKRDHVVER